MPQGFKGLEPGLAEGWHVANHHFWCMLHHAMHQVIASLHHRYDRHTRCHQVRRQRWRRG